MASTIEAVRPARPENQAALIFVHGFTGSGRGTWSDLGPRIADDPRLKSWDAWTVTYASSWLPDIAGIWSADADLGILAGRLATDLGKGTLASYKALVLIAHSMGGLIVQKALVDNREIAQRTSSVVLFGTPSLGLVKARTIWFWKRQLEDMSRSGPFITDLRKDWSERFGAGTPFSFLAVAGEKDQFVPPNSSLAAFPDEHCAVVPGNHVTMVHPSAKDPGTVDLTINRIVCEGPAGNIADSALVAIERGNFREVVRDLLSHADELDEGSLVKLAIALDALGRREEAYRLLARDGELGTDVLGTLAGRLKRSWLFSGRRKADAAASEAHYLKGFTLSRARNHLEQSYYHGINLAFLAFVYQRDRKSAKRYAGEVLEICEASRKVRETDEWVDATEGEAHLILGQNEASFEAYRRFVAAGNDPWKVGSTYLNARMIARELGDRKLAAGLGEIFNDLNP